MVLKGRKALIAAERHYKTRLSSNDVETIRFLAATKQAAPKELAAKFGVSRPHISGIISGKYRKHG